MYLICLLIRFIGCKTNEINAYYNRLHVHNLKSTFFILKVSTIFELKMK